MGFTKYYDIQRGDSIDHVLSRWVKGEKAYDEFVHNFYQPEDVWPYREYTWYRNNARRSPDEWDELFASLQQNGWDQKNPGIITVGKNGIAKLSEGNHRLAIAMQLGIKVPIRFEFWQTVDKSID